MHVNAAGIAIWARSPLNAVHYTPMNLTYANNGIKTKAGSAADREIHTHKLAQPTWMHEKHLLQAPLQTGMQPSRSSLNYLT